MVTAEVQGTTTKACPRSLHDFGALPTAPCAPPLCYGVVIAGVLGHLPLAWALGCAAHPSPASLGAALFHPHCAPATGASQPLAKQ